MEELKNMEIETQNPSPPLPQELIDYIIDILTSDIPMLWSCSLVCRLFPPGARGHLFREVNIGTWHLRQSFYVPCLSSPDILHVVKSLIGVIPGEEGVSSPTSFCNFCLDWTKSRSLEWNSMCPRESFELLNTSVMNTAHSMDITLYSRHHILQMRTREQLSKGVLRTIKVFHIRRDAHIHDDLPILRMSRLRSISVCIWDHHSKSDINFGLPDLGLLKWWI
ncbi:hypothetical protein IW262DRAFT_486865 [Armillaria fumosa]|nr:hypothetical protein IW262DRAFT_486865 [Armillaria fumosa]